MYKTINDFERRVTVSFKSESCNETTEVVLGERLAVAAGGGGGEGGVLSIVKMAGIRKKKLLFLEWILQNMVGQLMMNTQQKTSFKTNSKRS